MSLLLALSLAAVAPPAEPISLTAKSWGKVVTDWTMQADGSIEYKEAVDRPGGDFRNYDLAIRRTPPDAARRKWLADVLEPARKAAASPPDCGGRIPDLMYGEARWGATSLKFDAGCQGAEAARLAGLLRKADAQVKTWAHKTPEVERRPATVD